MFSPIDEDQVPGLPKAGFDSPLTSQIIRLLINNLNTTAISQFNQDTEAIFRFPNLHIIRLYFKSELN